VSHVSALVAQALAATVTDVFGVMGNGNAYFIDAVERLGVRYTPLRHEAGTVVAADAYFRASGRVAVATTTYGAGFTNALTALAESAQARIPLLLVTGAEPTTGPRRWDVDQIALAEAVGVRTVTVDAGSVPLQVAEAVATATTTRRPVVLAIPYDLASAPADPDAAADPERSRHLPPADGLTAALLPIADRLAAARHPVLLAGRGAWLADAGPALGRLAEVTGALTGSTALARGIFPEASTHLGIVGGFGQATAMERIGEADAVVAFGASLNQFTMRFGQLIGPDTFLAQIDVEAAPTNPRVDAFVRGDARIAAEALAELVTDRAPAAEWAPDPASWSFRDPAQELAADGRLDPRALAGRLAELLPEDRIVTSDGGHFLGWPNMYWPVAAPDRMIMVGTAYQSIGLGWPSVVGAARANPDPAIVLVTGDGGGLMALADLESAVRVAGGRGIAVVWNDAAYGAEVNLYGLKGLAQAPMRIPEVDFAALAESVGAEGVTVTRLADLQRLRAWAATPVGERSFLVLDCRISPDVIAPYQREVIEAHG